MQGNLFYLSTAHSNRSQTKSRQRAGSMCGFRRLLGSTKGNAIVEFALVLPIFLMMVCGITDFTRLLFQQATLQNAVRAAGRYATTGNHQPNPQNPNQLLSRVASINSIAQQAAMGLSVSNLQVSSLSGGSGNAGGPLDVVTVSLTSNVKLLTPVISQFFPNGIFTFTVSSTYKNEPFPPSQTT